MLLVTQIGSGANEQLPAARAGGLYKINCPGKDAFVEASPARVFRDGEGTLLFHLSHDWNVVLVALPPMPWHDRV
jgi:hypothetical protein